MTKSIEKSFLIDPLAINNVTYHELLTLIQESSQFTSVPWSNTSRKYFINLKHTEHVKHAVLWSKRSTSVFEACHFMKYSTTRLSQTLKGMKKSVWLNESLTYPNFILSQTLLIKSDLSGIFRKVTKEIEHNIYININPFFSQ